MLHFLVIIVLIVVIFTIVITVFLKCSSDSKRIYDTLASFKTLASVATDNEELKHVESSLRAYIKKECWHRHHMSHANEVLSYIKGRQDGGAT